MTKSENKRVYWGARGIGGRLNLSEKSAYHLLETGRLPATKVGGRWAMTDEAAVKLFEPALADKSAA